MELEQQSPSKVRAHLESLGIELNEGSVAGQMDINESLNLNAAAIGLGLQDIEYDPDTFPALIYQFDNQGVTAILYESGLIATVDGASKDSVRNVYDTIIDQLSEIGLLEDTSGREVSIPAEMVPSPPIAHSEAEMSESSGKRSDDESIDQPTEETRSETGAVDEKSDEEIREDVRDKFEYTSDE